jgi:hypothetical protein
LWKAEALILFSPRVEEEDLCAHTPVFPFFLIRVRSIPFLRCKGELRIIFASRYEHPELFKCSEFPPQLQHSEQVKSSVKPSEIFHTLFIFRETPKPAHQPHYLSMLISGFNRRGGTESRTTSDSRGSRPRNQACNISSASELGFILFLSAFRLRGPPHRISAEPKLSFTISSASISGSLQLVTHQKNKVIYKHQAAERRSPFCS